MLRPALHLLARSPARLLPALGLLLALQGACIERPETPASRAPEVDRSRLGDVLLTAPPSPRVLVGARFEGGIELLGYDVSPDPVPAGQRATVTFYWRAREDVNEDWKVFVHIDDEEKEAPRIGADHWPAGDRFRTSAWRKGDIVKDSFSFTVPARGVQRLEVWTGLYQDDQRLPLLSAGRGITDGQNRVRAGGIAVQ